MPKGRKSGQIITYIKGQLTKYINHSIIQQMYTQCELHKTSFQLSVNFIPFFTTTHYTDTRQTTTFIHEIVFHIQAQLYIKLIKFLRLYFSLFYSHHSSLSFVLLFFYFQQFVSQSTFKLHHSTIHLIGKNVFISCHHCKSDSSLYTRLKILLMFHSYDLIKIERVQNSRKFFGLYTCLTSRSIATMIQAFAHFSKR